MNRESGNAADEASSLPVEQPPDTTETARRSAPLEGEWIEKWTMASGATVFVTRPLGATNARPIVIGIHGAEDRADWACSEWHGTTAGFAWTLCPQGVPLRLAYAWPSPDAIAAQALEARDALRARYGSYVAPGPMLYGGFSQGASLASSVVAAHPGEFDAVVMVEAGHTPLSASGVVLGLRKGGVEHAILSCSTGGCAEFSSKLALAAKRSSFDLLTNDAGRRGHVFDGAVIKSVGETMVKLVAGDSRYEGFADAVAAR
jgi:pimeloyl-ACP methyl ester carboxylesterase